MIKTESVSEYRINNMGPVISDQSCKTRKEVNRVTPRCTSERRLRAQDMTL
jgi:hypothetical protein